LRGAVSQIVELVTRVLFHDVDPGSDGIALGGGIFPYVVAIRHLVSVFLEAALDTVGS
jgi:hypothetical protein